MTLTKRKPLVAGNWKMNGTFEEANQLLVSIADQLAEHADEELNTDVLVCPPYVYLEASSRILSDTPVLLGAQDVCTELKGAYTGEISACMLKDLTCNYVLVGHSERRSIYNESDTTVGHKYDAAAKSGLSPILCVGETLDERASGKANDVIKRQLDAVIDIAGINSFAHGVIAYEPVWAIGTGKTASPQQAQDIHAYIREMIALRSGKIADEIRILYGGSVKPANAADLFSMQDIDGGLIGGASLKADDFIAIVNAAAESYTAKA